MGSQNKTIGSVWLTVLLYVLCSVPLSGQEVSSRIGGEPDLLNMLRDAMRSNVERYPHGDMDVVATTGRSGKPVQRRVEARVRWDGDRQRLTGTAVDLVPNREGRGFGHQKQVFDIIDRDSTRQFHVVDQKLLTITDIRKFGPSNLTRLRPRDWWFGRIDGEQRDWAETYDIMLHGSIEDVRQVRARRLDDDRIEVARDSGATGGFRNVFSLKDDGNMVFVTMSDLIHEYNETRKYDWARDHNDRCYLKSCRLERRYLQRVTHDKVTDVWTYVVRQFNADVRPSSLVFEQRDLKLAPGTIIEDRITGKRRKLGDRPEEDMGKLLDKLVPEIKSRGLAAPERAK